MKELLIMAKSLGGGGSEVALIELINALPEELYNITLVLLDSDNEYAYRLKKKVNIVQLTFNCSFAKSLVSMYAFPAKVLKKLSVNSFIPYYDFISNCVTNVFEKTYDVAIDFYGYGSFVTAFLATKIQANWLEQIHQMKNRDIRTIEQSELQELPQDAVEHGLPQEERLKNLLDKVGNPYCYLDNGIIVKLNFAPRGSSTLSERIGRCFQSAS